MFTLDTAIDAIQMGKKEFVKTFVKNDVLADAMIKFVDSQTTYTKSAVNASTNAFSTIAGETIKVVQDFGKIDYAKFGEGVMKAWQATQGKK